MIKQPYNTPIDGRPHGLKRDQAYRLEKEYIYKWDKNGETYRIIIPEGLVYDGASIPRLTWTLTGMRPDGLLRAAALVHDFIYIHKGKMPKGSYQMHNDKRYVDLNTRWTRKKADKMFAQILKESGVSRFKRRIAYRAVRIGGWLAWRT